MTKLKGFKKNQFDYKIPQPYMVRFASGHTEEVMATSARDAELKTNHLQNEHGYFVGANKK